MSERYLNFFLLKLFFVLYLLRIRSVGWLKGAKLVFAPFFHFKGICFTFVFFSISFLIKTNLNNNSLTLDLTYLQKLSNGNDKFLQDILKTISKASEGYLKKIKGFDNPKNIDKTKFNLHKLQTPLNSLGLKTLNNNFLFVETYIYSPESFPLFIKNVQKIVESSHLILIDLNNIIK